MSFLDYPVHLNIADILFLEISMGVDKTNEMEQREFMGCFMAPDSMSLEDIGKTATDLINNEIEGDNFISQKLEYEGSTGIHIYVFGNLWSRDVARLLVERLKELETGSIVIRYKDGGNTPPLESYAKKD